MELEAISILGLTCTSWFIIKEVRCYITREWGENYVS